MLHSAESVSRAAIRGVPVLARRSFIMNGSGSAYIGRQVLDVREIGGLVLVIQKRVHDF
jgi:hypothetical protein